MDRKDILIIHISLYLIPGFFLIFGAGYFFGILGTMDNLLVAVMFWSGVWGILSALDLFTAFSGYGYKHYVHKHLKGDKGGKDETRKT